MKIYTNQDIREIDRLNIERDGLTAMELIERVAEAVVAEITSRWRTSKPVVVFAGPGNNGADGLAVARLLAEQGYKIHIYLFNIGGNKLTMECAACRDMVATMPTVSITEVIETFMMPDLHRNYLIIDALFGSGLKKSLEGGFAYLVQRINEANATVVSIDVPSGLCGDWNPNLLSRAVVHATLTLTVQFPRLSFFIDDSAQLAGEWRLIDIGLDEKVLPASAPVYYLFEDTDCRKALRRRSPFASKRDFGHALVFAGSYGMMGAAVMAARGALRSGVGKLTVEAPKCGFSVLQTAVPEAMFSHNSGELFIDRISPAPEYDAIAIGPGIGTRVETVRALEEFLAATKTPVLLDADALNCIARRPSMLELIPVLSVITPHPGEFDRIFGQHPTAEARLKTAVEMARRYSIIIVLKSHYTAIVRPDGKIYFNSSGCAAMATPGSGDVLTGLIASLMAQRYKPELAALIGVYIHGVAGEIAADIHGEYGTTALDIADSVGRAIKTVMKE